MRQIQEHLIIASVALGLLVATQQALSIDKATVTTEPATEITLSGPMTFSAKVRSLGGGWYRADLELPKFFENSVQNGQKVTLRLPFTQNRSLVSALKTDKSRQPYLKFQFPHSALDGMSLKADLIISATKLYSIPLSSVFSPTEDQQWVFVVEDQKAKKVKVQPYKVKEGAVLVFASLNKDSLIISSRLNEIYETQAVEVRK
ncbi:MAG: hypothetical protein HRT45_04445 [Bdellovibrionales bacterium]|nr:hypothetical protein [Bdellovibrionales bacterium]